MEFGIVGLGRMGANLALAAVEKGIRVVGFDPAAIEELLKEGVELSADINWPGKAAPSS